MAASSLASPHGEPDEPENQKDRCSDPQDVQCESCSKENQDHQQRKYQYHRTTSLLDIRFGLRRGSAAKRPATRSAAPAEGEAGDPNDGEHGRGNPQKVDGEAGPEQNDDQNS
jgi:hypothetical protein